MGASSWLEDDDLEDAEMKLSNILPKTGNYLGLDISKNSTGICLVSDGKITTGNITLSDEQVSIKNSDNWCFEEVLLRRCFYRRKPKGKQDAVCFKYCYR